jgi:hypothetical protein
MDTKIIQTTMAFMQRVNLTGAEVPAFAACMQELQRLAQQAEAPVPMRPKLSEVPPA